MLQTLEIKNYAIIDHVLLRFDKGLNIITGETGAGKSILLGALGLTLGDRVDSKVLYNQTEKCFVEATFSIEQYKLNAFFESHELDYEPATIIRREISASGKSRAFINDTPVTLNVLKDLTTQLVNLHSQQETSSLNDDKAQLQIVDFVAKNNELRQSYTIAYKQWQKSSNTLQRLIEQQAQVEKDEAYNQFQIEEIEEANVVEDNLDDLESQLSVLANAETIKTHLASVVNLIDNEEYAAISSLNQALHQLQAIAKYNNNYKELLDRLDSTIIEIEDIKTEVENLADKTEVNQESLEVLSTKINSANRLLKKHQLSSLEDLKKLLENLHSQVAQVAGNKSEISRLEKEVEEQEEAVKNIASKISASRRKAIPTVEQEITETLKKVGMAAAQFKIDIKETANFGVTGKDQVNFLFSANKGFAPQALKSIASGGELSRVMLSIKSLMALSTSMPTLIFDEIDTGISGETAAKVAEVFVAMSQNLQLISITHLPQIASKAHKHFFISKSEENHKTTTHIQQLDKEQHIHAIARMLSGENISEASIINAKQLIG